VSSQSDAVATALRFGFSTFALFVAFNLPWRYGEFVSEVAGEIPENSLSLAIYPRGEDGLIRCGWPYCYAEIALTSPGSDLAGSLDWQGWSGLHLLADVALAVTFAIAVAALAYIWRYLAIVVIAAAVLCVANSMHQGYRQDQRLGEALKPYGAVYRSAFIPRRVARLMPPRAQAIFSRIHGVVFYNANEKAVALASSIPTLQSLGLRGRLPEPVFFQALNDHPRLRQLVIINTVLQPGHVALIGAQADLEELTLISCRGLRGALGDLEGLPLLRRVNLSGSEIDLDALSRSRWGTSVHELVLSPQLTGNNQLRLADWPRLESLALRVNRGGSPAGTMTISLERLPQLHSLGLISGQRIDLRIVSAPHLHEIRVDDTDDAVVGLVIERVPTKLWLESLELQNVPSLRRLACYGMDLESLKIDSAPNLIELTIDAQLHEPNKFQKHPSDQQRTIARIIRDLGQCDGPPIISLETVPLAGVDLTPLIKNDRIRELRLSGTGISSDQVLPLLELPRLDALDLRGCPISNELAQAILASRPNLRQLLVDAHGFRRLEVIDHDLLSQFTTTPLLQASIVRVQRSPQLQSALVLGDRLKELTIIGSPAVTGLSVNGPMPADTRLEDFRDLRFFAVGGANVDDKMCSAVWDCPKLDHLTLAYTSLSRRSLLQVGQLKDLSTLILPGADVDDSVTSSWRDLKQLCEVDLSRTNISRGTFQFLMSLKNLQRLAINHVPLDRSDLRPLVAVTQLIELEVAGIGLDDDLLEALLKRGLLDRLVVSDTELSNRAVELLASPVARSLVFLGMRECGLTEDDVRRILDEHEQLVVDVSGHPLSDDFIDELRRNNRLVNTHDRPRFLRQVRSFSHEASDVEGLWFDTILGRIDVHRFLTPQIERTP
jgi:hypothetical protein